MMNKISYKLAAYFLVMVFIIELALFTSLYFSLTNSRAKEVVDALLIRGNNHSKVLEQHYSVETLKHVALMESQTDTAVVITAKNTDDILVQSNNVTPKMLTHLSWEMRKVPKEGLIMEDHWRTEQYICTVSPIKINNQIKGYVYMFQDTSYIHSLMWKMGIQFVLTFFLTIIITFFSIVFLSKRVTKPIVKMKRMTEQLARGIYNKTDELHTNDEIGDLSRSIHQLGKELEVLKKNRNEFLASVAHELRTPLTYIQGYLDVIMQAKLPFEKQEKYLVILINETKQLTKLIEDLFLLARMDQNEFAIEKQRVDLESFLSSIVQRSHIAFSHTHIQITYLSNSSSCNVEMDILRMEQVFMNLIQNGVRHSAEGDCITIHYVVENEQVSIFVTDQGEGIPSEDMERVFEPFYRVNKARTRKTGGFGLGLAIIKEIVEKHDGTISLQSEPGVGTTVKITLLLSKGAS